MARLGWCCAFGDDIGTGRGDDAGMLNVELYEVEQVEQNGQLATKAKAFAGLTRGKGECRCVIACSVIG